MAFKPDPQADISDTSKVLDLEVAPAELVRAFGAPHRRVDNYKVSGMYCFVDGSRVFTVYDWKATSLYWDHPELPSPLAFWNSREKDFLSIGSNCEDAQDFRDWLLERIGNRGVITEEP